MLHKEMQCHFKKLPETLCPRERGRAAGRSRAAGSAFASSVPAAGNFSWTPPEQGAEHAYFPHDRGRERLLPLCWGRSSRMPCTRVI